MIESLRLKKEREAQNSTLQSKTIINNKTK